MRDILHTSRYNYSVRVVYYELKCFAGLLDFLKNFNSALNLIHILYDIWRKDFPFVLLIIADKEVTVDD